MNEIYGTKQKRPFEITSDTPASLGIRHHLHVYVVIIRFGITIRGTFFQFLLELHGIPESLRRLSKWDGKK